MGFQKIPPVSGDRECANLAEEAAAPAETEHVFSVGSETDVQQIPPVSGDRECANQTEEAATPLETEHVVSVGSETEV